MKFPNKKLVYFILICLHKILFFIENGNIYIFQIKYVMEHYVLSTQSLILFKVYLNNIINNNNDNTFIFMSRTLNWILYA